MKTIQQQLRLMGACAEAREWAEDKTASEIWATCERGDWMLWWAGSLSKRETAERKIVVLAACECAELVLPIFEARYADDKRPRTAIETARRWARGEATIDDVRVATNAAYAAYAAADAAAYAAYAADADAAAYAAADAAAYAAYAAYAADAYAAYAAAYAAYAAANAADADARASTLRQCADIVRKWIPVMPEMKEIKGS